VARTADLQTARKVSIYIRTERERERVCVCLSLSLPMRSSRCAYIAILIHTSRPHGKNLHLELNGPNGAQWKEEKERTKEREVPG